MEPRRVKFALTLVNFSSDLVLLQPLPIEVINRVSKLLYGAVFAWIEVPSIELLLLGDILLSVLVAVVFKALLHGVIV